MSNPEFLIDGRAKLYMMNAIRTHCTDPSSSIYFFGGATIIQQATNIIGAAGFDAGRCKGIVLENLDVDAIKSTVANFLDATVSARDIFVSLPASYPEFIYFNRGMTALRKAGYVCIIATLRDFQFPGDRCDATGILSRLSMFAWASQYIASQSFNYTKRGKFGYYEFGVFDGSSMSMAFRAFGDALPHMRFIAFDTFAGISSPRAVEEDSFPEGDWAANLASFKLNMQIAGPPEHRLQICAGNMVDVLSDIPEAIRKRDLLECAIAHIDCDVYEPAKAALNLLKHVMINGGLVLFDDYDTMDARDDLGERRALKEFLAENPDISFEPSHCYGLHCRTFIFQRHTSTVGNLTQSAADRSGSHHEELLSRTKEEFEQMERRLSRLESTVGECVDRLKPELDLLRRRNVSLEDDTDRLKQELAQKNLESAKFKSIRDSLAWKFAAPLWRLETRRQRKAKRRVREN